MSKQAVIGAGSVVAPRELVSVSGDAVPIPDPDRLIHLQFRRFAGCPICNVHLQSIARRHNEIDDAGIREVVVFHSTDEELRRYVADLPFAVVGDPDKVLYAEFGVGSSPRAVLDPAGGTSAGTGGSSEYWQYPRSQTSGQFAPNRWATGVARGLSDRRRRSGHRLQAWNARRRPVVGRRSLSARVVTQGRPLRMRRQRNHGAQRLDGVVVTVEFDALQRCLAPGFGGAEPGGGEICRTSGDRHRWFAVSGRETALIHRELETAAVDFDTV